MKYVVILALLWGLSGAASAEPPSGYLVVVNAENPQQSLPRILLREMFKGKLKKWPEDGLAKPIDQRRHAPVRIKFLGDVLETSPDGIMRYWNRQIFSGGHVPPVEKNSDQEVLAHVRENPGGVGYISPDTELGPGVKVLRVTRKGDES